MASSQEDASPEEIKAFLNKRQHYIQCTQLALPQSVHQATTMKTMENRRRRNNRKMPDRRRELKGKASTVTSLVTGKRNADRGPVIRKMGQSEQEKGHRTQMTVPSTTES